MEISIDTEEVRFSIDAQHPLCARMLEEAGLLLMNSKLVNVVRCSSIIKINSTPYHDPIRINYQYFKRDNYDGGHDDLIDGENSFEYEFAMAVRDLLGLEPEDYESYEVTYEVEERDIRYETVTRFSVLLRKE